jgi:hypothetical protein
LIELDQREYPHLLCMDFMVQKQIEKEDGHQGDDEGNGSTKSEVSLIELDRLGAVCLSEKLRQNSYWKHMSKIIQLVD